MRSSRSLQRPNVAAVSALTTSDALSFALSHLSGLTFSSDPESEVVESLFGDPKSILGLRSSRSLTRSDLMLRHIHPDDRFRILQALETTLRDEQRTEPVRLTYRWIRPDIKETRTIVSSSILEPKTETTKQLITCLYDVTNLSEEIRFVLNPLEGLSEHVSLLGDAVFLLDSEMRLRSWKLPWGSISGPLGDPGIRKMDLRTGTPFLSLIRDETKKREWQVRLDDALVQGMSSSIPDWQEGERYLSISTSALSKEDLPYGILIRVTDVTEKYSLSNAAKLSFNDLQKSKVISWATKRLANDLLSLAGLNSIITRHSAPHSLSSSASQESQRIMKHSIELAQLISSREFNDPDESLEIDLNQLTTRLVKSFSLDAVTSMKLALSLGKAVRLKCNLALAELIIRRVLASTSLLNQHDTSISILTDQSKGPNNEASEHSWGRLLIRISVPNSRIFSWPDSFIEELNNIEQATAGTEITLAASRKAAGEIAITLYFPGEKIKSRVLQIESNSHLRLALLDFDQSSQSAYKNMICDLGFACLTFSSFEELSEAFQSEALPIVLLRAASFDSNIAFTIKRIKRISPSVKIIALTGIATAERDVAERAGALSSMCEPVDPAKLKKVLATTFKLINL